MWDTFNTSVPARGIADVVAAIAQLEAKYPDALRIEISALYSGGIDVHIEFKVTKPEDEASYQQRISKAQEKLAAAGITNKFMCTALGKVNKALVKLGAQ